MTDSSNARSKAEACIRLANVADHARTVELFRQLANEYLTEAGIGGADMTMADQPASAVAWALADLQAMSGEVVAIEAPAVAPMDVPAVAETRPAETSPQAEYAPPLAPVTDSEQFLARFKALRASAEI
jgi:hypothetical protein